MSESQSEYSLPSIALSSPSRPTAPIGMAAPTKPVPIPQVYTLRTVQDIIYFIQPSLFHASHTRRNKGIKSTGKAK